MNKIANRKELEIRSRDKPMSKGFSRMDLVFKSHGMNCAAWLYLPKGITRPPIVIMAHGFGGERTFRLAQYAEFFTRQGLASFVFDYRNFGGSEGEPRNLISPSRHLEDWQAAIQHVKSLESVDSGRMGLWGTSFSGGHVIVTASRTPGISAIVAQVPFVDGRASLSARKHKLQALYHGLLDALGTAILRRRHYVPIVGEPGRFALLNTPDALEGGKIPLPPGIKPGRKCPAITSEGLLSAGSAMPKISSACFSLGAS